MLTATVLVTVWAFQQQNGTTELEEIQRAPTGMSYGLATLLRRRLLDQNPYLGTEVMDKDFLKSVSGVIIH